MKTRNASMKLIAMVIAVAIATAIWTVWGTRTAEAIVVVAGKTGMFSLARGQATSAHVVNTWAGDERTIIVNFRVLDSQGNTLAQSERQMVAPGQASTYEYGTGVYTPARMAIRLVLTVEGASRNKPDFIATQEVFNMDDGKTTVFLPYLEQ